MGFGGWPGGEFLAHLSHIFLLMFLGAIGQSVLEFGSPCFVPKVVWVWSFLFPDSLKRRVPSFIFHAVVLYRLTFGGTLDFLNL